MSRACGKQLQQFNLVEFVCHLPSFSQIRMQPPVDICQDFFCLLHIFMELVHMFVDHTALSNSHYPIMLQNGSGKGCYHPELHDWENLTGWKWIRGGLFWGATQQNKIFTSDASWILSFNTFQHRCVYFILIYIYTWNPNDPCFEYTRPCFWGSNPPKTKHKWGPGI